MLGSNFDYTRRDRNRLKVCPVCHRPRTGISTYCRKHLGISGRLGHPKAKPISIRVLRPIRRRLYHIKDWDEEAWSLALQVCNRIVCEPGCEEPKINPRTPEERRRYRVLRELHRLQHPAQDYRPRGISRQLRPPVPVSPRDVLLTALAVVCAVWLDPKLLPDDGKCLSYAIGRSVLKMRPYRQIRDWQGRR